MSTERVDLVTSARVLFDHFETYSAVRSHNQNSWHIQTFSLKIFVTFLLYQFSRLQLSFLVVFFISHPTYAKWAFAKLPKWAQILGLYITSWRWSILQLFVFEFRALELRNSYIQKISGPNYWNPKSENSEVWKSRLIFLRNIRSDLIKWDSLWTGWRINNYKSDFSTIFWQ